MAGGGGIRALVAALTAVATVGVASAVAATGAAAAPPPAGGAAPGAPGVDEQYLPADMAGFGTATSTGSTVWFTVQKRRWRAPPAPG